MGGGGGKGKKPKQTQSPVKTGGHIMTDASPKKSRDTRRFTEIILFT